MLLGAPPLAADILGGDEEQFAPHGARGVRGVRGDGGDGGRAGREAMGAGLWALGRDLLG